MLPIGTVLDSPQTGERLIIRSTKESSDGEVFRAELIAQPVGYVVQSHVHPNQEERFVVLEGRYGWQIGRERGVAGPGETLVCPPGVPHHQWNAGSTPMRIYYEHRPALESAELFFETQFGLSRDGKLSKSGRIALLQAAVLVAEVGDFIRPSWGTLALQDALFAPLAALGRWRGYKSRYPHHAHAWC